MNSVATWPSQAETWLDQRGKGAWIVAMVVGFIAFWPVGLAILGYMLFAGKFAKAGGCSRRGRSMRRASFRSSGNSAFDAYKAATLRRLEEEQEAFEAFLSRLREAKDKAEFDQFMDDRARHAKPADEERSDA
jgi:hypothetical protein